MKFSLKKDNLGYLVGLAERVTGKNLSLPVLSAILLETTDKKLIIKATNLEVGLEIETPLISSEPGRVAITGSVLGNFLGNLSGGEKIEASEENGNLIVMAGKNQATIKCQPADDFPIIPRVAPEEGFEIDAGRFVGGLRAVVYSASLSTIKPEIASVYLYQNDGKLMLVATDSFRLAEKKLDLGASEVPENLNLIIPLKNVLEVIRVFDNLVGEMKVNWDKNQIAFATDNLYLTSRLIDGVFPDYRQIVPKDFNTEISVSKTELLNTLKITAIFTDKLNQTNLTILPKEGVIEIKTHNDSVGANTSKLSATISGEAFELVINSKYLFECLNSINSENINLRIVAPNKPIVVSGAGDQSFIYLIMPINR